MGWLSKACRMWVSKACRVCGCRRLLGCVGVEGL